MTTMVSFLSIPSWSPADIGDSSIQGFGAGLLSLGPADAWGGSRLFAGDPGERGRVFMRFPGR